MASVLIKSLARLPREALIDLALRWSESQHNSPYLSSNRNVSETFEEDYLHTPAEDIVALRQIWEKLRQHADTPPLKREIIDRIVDGDWRRGLSLDQLAMIDFAYLEQNDTALRWSALKVAPLEHESFDYGDEPPLKKRRTVANVPEHKYPTIAPAAFIKSLKAEISPLVKAHYYLHRLPPPYELSIVRLHVFPDKPFAPSRSSVPRKAKQAMDASRVMYIALPYSCPYVYVSLSGSGNTRSNNGNATQAKLDMAAMKRIVLEAIPKALSKSQERWCLEKTNLNAKSLRSLCSLKGPKKPGSGGGYYQVMVDDKNKKMNSAPVDVKLPRDAKRPECEEKPEVEERFGRMQGSHHAALDRVQVKIQDITSVQHAASTVRAEDSASVMITFCGSDVFQGLKKLAELGSDFVDLEKIPAWMTGDCGVSSLAV